MYCGRSAPPELQPFNPPGAPGPGNTESRQAGIDVGRWTFDVGHRQPKVPTSTFDVEHSMFDVQNMFRDGRRCQVSGCQLGDYVERLSVADAVQGLSVNRFLNTET